jgi:hypothetical protein
LQGYVITGRLPQSLLMSGLKVKDAGASAAEQVSEQDMRDFPAFAASVLRECCVNPKPDQVDMLPEDAWEIYQWAMTHQGVTGIDGLRSFRGERPNAPAPKPDRPELPRETVTTVADER